MVAAILNANRADDFRVAQMHRDRKAVFVDELKWQVPVVEGEFEIDEYDTDDAVYLVATGDVAPRHLGSVRLVCTAGPHLLADKFAYLVDGDVPTGPDVWEISRLCTTPGLSPAAALNIRMELVIALIEYALSNDIGRYTMMTHMAYVATLLAVGWNIAPLGQPADVAGEPVGALVIRIDAATLPRLRKMYGFRQPVLAADELRPWRREGDTTLRPARQ